jgi:hypothetical protein
MDRRNDAASALRQLPASLKKRGAKQRDNQPGERMTGKGDFHSALLSMAARQPGTRKNPRQVNRRGCEK